jgi:hypothetical protein
MKRRKAMKELTFEVPIDQEAEGAVLADALKHVEILSLLEIGAEGLLLLCRGSREGVRSFRDSISRDASGRVSATVVGREEGSETLLVSAKWMAGLEELDRRQMKELDFFRAMEKAPIYQTKGPIMQGGRIVFSVVAGDNVVRRLLRGLSELEVPYKVLSLGHPRARAEPVLGILTAKQAGTLRLAHAMGYYEIPRRTSTEELARHLGMDKGTVGEHLRRAEKHVFDRLLS